MDSFSKPISKTVQRRQLKRLKPRHHEIIARMFMGQNQRKMAKAMRIEGQQLSGINNSPVVKEEVKKRMQAREDEVIKRLRDKEQRRLEAVTNMMRNGVGDLSILSPGPIEHKKPEKHINHPNDLGERIVKSLAQLRA